MDDSNKLSSKLIPLRNSMRENEKAVIVFRFHYKRSGYYVAVCLLTDEDKKKKEAKYALVRLCFILQNDLNQYLDCYANSIKFSAGMTELRNFLGVEFQPDGREWIQGFTQYFGKFIPEYIPQMDSSEKRIALHTICRHEGRDPNRIYRSYIFRNGKQNGKQKYRTEYNGQLASEKFLALYPKFKQDRTISFAFTDDPSLEKSEEEILKNFERSERNKSD